MTRTSSARAGRFPTLGVAVTYVVANPSSYAWPDATRPQPTGDGAPESAKGAWETEKVHTGFSYGVFDASAQLQAQHPMVKGIVGRGNMAFLRELLHDVQRELGPLLIPETMHQVVQQLQDPPARFLSLGIALAHGLLEICQLLFLLTGLLHQHLDAIQTGTIGNGRRHHCLIRC